MHHFERSQLDRIDDEQYGSLAKNDFDIDNRLQQIKALFVFKKHRQCLQLCASTLAETDDKEVLLYLHFYMGLAHDDLGRAMYDLSRFKPSRFKLGEQHYCEALNIVSEMEYAPLLEHRLPREASSISLLSMFSDRTVRAAQQSEIIKHIRGMKEQIMTHLALTERAKKRSEGMLAKRQRIHSLNSPFMASSSPGLQSSKSYWSFTPETTKASERQLRIEDGRARGWSRHRFEPERYRVLADDALAEL